MPGESRLAESLAALSTHWLLVQLRSEGVEVEFEVLEQFKKKSDFVPQRHLAMCPGLSPRSFRETSFVQ